MTLDGYLANRRYWEVAFALLIVTISFVTNLGTELIERARASAAMDATEPLVLELTSHIAMFVVIPAVLLFNSRYPIQTSNWRRRLALHLGFSVIFSFLHVALMYWGRVFVFRLIDPSSPYRWASWWGEFGYEYLKDCRSYFTILAIVYLYQFILRRLQGEAGFLSEKQHQSQETTQSDRFLVKKLGREFLVRIDEIDWVEACGNYVNLHVGSRVYPLRETMTRIDERLQAMEFQRVHRSAIVNLEQVAEIVAFDSGDGEVKLRTDAVVPVSRRYRQSLRENLGK